MSVNVCLTVIFYEPLSTTLRDEEIDASHAINKKTYLVGRFEFILLGTRIKVKGGSYPQTEGSVLECHELFHLRRVYVRTSGEQTLSDSFAPGF